MSKKGKPLKKWNGKKPGCYRDAYTIEIKYDLDRPDDDHYKLKIDIERLIDTGRAYKC